jgi:hypothetical protein
MDLSNFLLIVAGFVKAKRWDELEVFYKLLREVLVLTSVQNQQKLDAIHTTVQASSAKLQSVLG